jgi:hypothetical protein
MLGADDLDIAPDFFDYFASTYPVLHSDPSLWCVSAWNDNGKTDLVEDNAGKAALVVSLQLQLYVALSLHCRLQLRVTEHVYY